MKIEKDSSKLNTLNFPFSFNSKYSLIFIIIWSILLFIPFRVFHINVNQWFPIGVWVIVSRLKSSGLFSVFCPICCSLDGLHLSCYFLAFQLLYQSFGDCTESTNYNWYHRHYNNHYYYFYYYYYYYYYFNWWHEYCIYILIVFLFCFSTMRKKKKEMKLSTIVNKWERVCLFSIESQTVCCPVGWNCRIHRLHLCRRIRTTPISVLDMTLNNLMVRFQ